MDLHLSAKSCTPAPGWAVLRAGRRFTLLGLGLAWRGLAWSGLCWARLAGPPVRVPNANVKVRMRVRCAAFAGWGRVRCAAFLRSGGQESACRTTPCVVPATQGAAAIRQAASEPFEPDRGDAGQSSTPSDPRPAKPAARLALGATSQLAPIILHTHGLSRGRIVLWRSVNNLGRLSAN